MDTDKTNIVVIDKKSKEILAAGPIVSKKETPETLISFDYKYFFSLRDNSFYEIRNIDNICKIDFDYKKYSDKIFPYADANIRHNPEELIFREFSIDELDPEIAPLVLELNKKGFKTTGSCCGHNENVAWIHITFHNMKEIYQIIDIISKEKFKKKFTLSTSPNIHSQYLDQIMLELKTTTIGEQAYKDILELTDFLKTYV